MSDNFQVCETCGVKFPPSTEVTSSRILCPACAAQRRAALRAAKGPAAPAAAPASAAAPAAAPAAPAAPAARAARPAAKPAPQPEPEASEPEPAPRRQRAPREEKKRPAHGPHEHLDVRRMKEESQQKVMKLAWAATGILLVIAGAFWFYRTSTLNSIADARAAVVKEREDFRDKVLKVDLTNEAALVAIREEIKDKIKIWKGKDVENDISTHLAKINSAYALIQKTRTLVDQLKGIETQLAANPPAEQLAKLFAQVRDSELAAQAAEAGGNYKTQYDTDVKTVTSKYVEALRARASPSGTTGEALAPYGPLEDTLRIVVDAAQMANDIDTVNQYKNSYTQCVAEINGIAEKLFDDAYIEKQAWKDLLADPGSWLVAESGSFTRKFGSGTLLLDNAEGGQSGGVLYTPGGQWRDYVLEMEVKLDKGTLSVFTRVGDENKLDTNAVPGFTFGTKNTKLNADYGRTQTLQVRVIGKKITVYVDNSPLYDDSLGLNKSRRGKPCLAVSGGTTANISKLRVKLLR